MSWYDRDGKPMSDGWWNDKASGGRTEGRVAKTRVGDVEVSTVWMGLDHRVRLGSAPPVFETMTFGERWDTEMARYASEEAAMCGHLDAVDRLRDGRPPFPRLDTSS